MYYFLDDYLDIKQEYHMAVMELTHSRIDVHASYRRQADARLADEVAAFVCKERDWKSYCTLLLPWQEIEPVGDTLDPSRLVRVRRHIYAYELSPAKMVKYNDLMRPAPVWRFDGVQAAPIEVKVRPIRGIADGRALVGAVVDDTLFITEMR